MSNPLEQCVLLIEKDYEAWLNVLDKCPSHIYFRHIMTLAFLKCAARRIKEPNESELARVVNMNRQTLGMFIRRLGLGSSREFFWGINSHRVPQ